MEMLVRLQVGEWRADRTTNELVRAGETVRVEPKAMEVLLALAQRAGQVVSREALLAAVWPEVVVGDEALTQSIIKLRRALRDDPRKPSYIETISKRGYRLIARVREGDQAPEAETRLRPTSRRLVAGLVFMLALVFVYGMHLIGRPIASPDDLGASGGRPGSYLTLTVAPFESLGAEGGQTYLARGISNDLMTDLSRLPGLRLVGASRATPAAGYLVSGSVQREAGILRINIRLTDTKSNRQLWSERIERPFGDLFAVQDEITRRLMAVLPGRLNDALRERHARPYTRSLEAYDDFLRAQALFLVRRSEDNEGSRAFYRKALELDPNFARAYAGLAMTYAMEYRLRPTGDSSPVLDRAFELAETARQIDPTIPEVYWALAFVHAQSRHHRQAIQLLQKAIELNRSYADAYAFMGGVYTYIGRPAKSISLLRSAMRLNPDGGHLYFLLLGRAYLFQNDTEQALINLREASARNRLDLETRLYLVAAMVATGDRFDAEWEVEQIRLQEPDFSLHAWLDAYPLTSARYRDRLKGLLAKAGL